MGKSRNRQVFVTASSLRSWSAKASPIFFLLVAFFLVLITSVNDNIEKQIRLTTADLMSPILDIASSPIEKIAFSFESVASFANLTQENKRLKLENERLRQWYQTALSLQVENQSLSKMLNLTKDPNYSFITTRVVSDPSSPFYQMVLIPAGQSLGVKEGHAAISKNGLIGRVTEVGSRSSRVLMITDMNSRIPVFIGGEKIRAILAGNNSEMPELDHVPRDVKINVGDRVVTSGQGGLFAPHIPVGTIQKMTDNQIFIQPYTDLSRLDYIQIVDFGLEDIF